MSVRKKEREREKGRIGETGYEARWNLGTCDRLEISIRMTVICVSGKRWKLLKEII